MMETQVRLILLLKMARRLSVMDSSTRLFSQLQLLRVPPQILQLSCPQLDFSIMEVLKQDLLRVTNPQQSQHSVSTSQKTSYVFPKPLIFSNVRQTLLSFNLKYSGRT